LELQFQKELDFVPEYQLRYLNFGLDRSSGPFSVFFGHHVSASGLFACCPNLPWPRPSPLTISRGRRRIIDVIERVLADSLVSGLEKSSVTPRCAGRTDR
jgi:hypothetical protein